VVDTDHVRIVQIAQHADDLQRATRFYALLLQAEPAAVYDPPGLVFFDLGGVRLMLEGAAPPAMLYLEVADIDAAVARLRAAGVPVRAEPSVIFQHPDATLGPAGSAEWHASVEDSEGNLVNLVELRAAR
jgi:methylmalonyl-CoA/ethylmalonyl-CoA epimerase